MVSIHGVTEHVKKLGNKTEQNFPLGKFGPYKIAITACGATCTYHISFFSTYVYTYIQTYILDKNNDHTFHYLAQYVRTYSYTAKPSIRDRHIIR